MKNFYSTLPFLLLTLIISSCSSYVNRIHQQMDREYMQRQGMNPNAQGPPSAQLMRQHREGQAVNTGQISHRPPSVQRQYGSPSDSRGIASSSQHGRTRAEDLRDNSGATSLWTSSESNLFTQTRSRRPGDIVLINVMDRLKAEITLELRRSFPAQRRPQSRDREQQGADQEAEEERTAAQESREDRIHGRISSVIVEQVSRDHVLIRGRKNVLYRNAQRLIEVQALISTRDILDGDVVPSDSIIESQVSVLR